MTFPSLSWRRIVTMTIVATTVLVGTGGAWLWHAQRNSPLSPTGEDITGARAELEGAIALSKHEGAPISSLADRCDARSPDSIQVFQEGGMFPPMCLAISLQGTHLKSACVQFTPNGKRYIPSESTLSEESVRKIWEAADQITTRMTSASAYPYEATDMTSIALESCRNGQYAWIERYMGTKDPDNAVLSDFNSSLWHLSGVNREN